MRLVVMLAAGLVMAWALGTLAEHFGWHLLREAGGQIVGAATEGGVALRDVQQ